MVNSQTIAGICIALFSAIAMNFGVNMQKLSFIYELRKPPQERSPYWFQARWWIGMAFVIAAALGNFAAFALAPQSVVAPIGAVNIVTNLILANRFLGEPLTRVDIIGTIAVCAGVALAVALAGTEDQQLTIDDISALWIDVRTLVYVLFVVLLITFYYVCKLRAEAVLQAHIERVGELLMQEAAKVGVYDTGARSSGKDSEAMVVMQVRSPSPSPGGSSVGTPASTTLPGTADSTGGDSEATPRIITAAVPIDSGAGPATPEGMSRPSSAASLGHSTSFTADTPRAEGQPPPGPPPGPPPRQPAPPPGQPARSSLLVSPSNLAAAAETVKRENKRSSAPKYAAPNMTAFMKDVDEVAVSALQAAGRRQRRESTPKSSRASSRQSTTESAGDLESGTDGTPGAEARLAEAGKSSGGSEEEDDGTFVDLDAVADIIGAPPAGYDWYASLHPLAYAGLAGVIGAQNTLFAKAVGEGLTSTIAGDNQFTNPLMYLYLVCLVASIVFQQHFLASGLQLFDALYIVPVFQAHFIVFGVLSGGLFYREFDQYDLVASIMFPIGLTIAISGVLALTMRGGGEQGDGDEADQEGASKPAPASPSATVMPSGLQDTDSPAVREAFADRPVIDMELSPVGEDSGDEVTMVDVMSGRKEGEVPTVSTTPHGHSLATQDSAGASGSFAEFVASRRQLDGVPSPTHSRRRGTSYLRNTWVESLLERKATLDGVVSFEYESEGGATPTASEGPRSTAPDTPKHLAKGKATAAPSPAAATTRRRHRTFSVSLGRSASSVAGGDEGGAGEAAATPAGRTRAGTADTTGTLPHFDSMHSVRSAQGSRGRPRRGSMLQAAMAGIQSTFTADTVAEVPDSDEEGEDVMAFGFDSEAEVARHLEQGAQGGTTAATPKSPPMKGRRGTMAGSVARGVASLSQLFLADHATAAMTAGSYAGRAGSVSLAPGAREGGGSGLDDNSPRFTAMSGKAPVMPGMVMEDSEESDSDGQEKGAAVPSAAVGTP